MRHREHRGSSASSTRTRPISRADAIKLAVDVLDGKPPGPSWLENDYPRLTTDIVKGDFSPGVVFEKLEIGKNVFPDLPPGLVLPVSPSWIDITPQEASGVSQLIADAGGD